MFSVFCFLYKIGTSYLVQDKELVMHKRYINGSFKMPTSKDVLEAWVRMRTDLRGLTGIWKVEKNGPVSRSGFAGKTLRAIG